MVSVNSIKLNQIAFRSSTNSNTINQKAAMPKPTDKQKEKEFTEQQKGAIALGVAIAAGIAIYMISKGKKIPKSDLPSTNIDVKAPSVAQNSSLPPSVTSAPVNHEIEREIYPTETTKINEKSIDEYKSIINHKINQAKKAFKSVTKQFDKVRQSYVDIELAETAEEYKKIVQAKNIPHAFENNKITIFNEKGEKIREINYHDKQSKVNDYSSKIAYIDEFEPTSGNIVRTASYGNYPNTTLSRIINYSPRNQNVSQIIQIKRPYVKVGEKTFGDSEVAIKLENFNDTTKNIKNTAHCMFANNEFSGIKFIEFDSKKELPIKGYSGHVIQKYKNKIGDGTNVVILSDKQLGYGKFKFNPNDPVITINLDKETGQIVTTRYNLDYDGNIVNIEREDYYNLKNNYYERSIEYMTPKGKDKTAKIEHDYINNKRIYTSVTGESYTEPI